MRAANFLLVLALPLLAFKCIDKQMRNNFIEISNGFSQNVYSVPSFSYPDTTLTYISKKQILANDSIYFLPSLGKRKLFYIPLCEEATWRRLNPNDTLQIFVLDEQTMKSQTWDDIVKNRMYLKRLSFTFKEIQQNECRIMLSPN